MTNANIMKFFVTGEGGTSALLATAFDPEFADERQRLFREKFCKRLESFGVDLSPGNGPEAVLPEYRGIDLVMMWGDWILVLENKVAAASITRGQLAGYYRTTLAGIKKGAFLDAVDQERLGLRISLKDILNKRICIVFVTPEDNMGNPEFNSVELERDRDRKARLAWPCILADLEQAFPECTVCNPFARLIRDARNQVEEVLKRPGPVIKPSKERDAMKAFVIEVRGRVGAMMKGFQPDLKLNIWRDPGVDILYGHIGGDKGNVNFHVLADESTSLVTKDEATLSGLVNFKVAGKAIATRRRVFCSVSRETWARILGLEPAGLSIEREKCRVVFTNKWEGKWDDLVEELAALFCRYLLVFRPFMVDERIANSEHE